VEEILLQWPDITGMAGRVFPESLAGCYRNPWPDNAGILKQKKMVLFTQR